jgi:hypothetical protein
MLRKQARTICWATEEFKISKIGKANVHVGLFEIYYSCLNKVRKPGWWVDVPLTTVKRRLTQLRALGLTRPSSSAWIGRCWCQCRGM